MSKTSSRKDSSSTGGSIRRNSGRRQGNTSSYIYDYDDDNLFEDETPSARSSRKNGSKGKKNKTGCALASLYFIIIFGVSVCLSLFLIFAANDVLALVKTDDDISASNRIPSATNSMARSRRISSKTGSVIFG